MIKALKLLACLAGIFGLQQSHKQAHAAGIWTNERVLATLKARESSIETLEAFVVRREVRGPESKQYFEADRLDTEARRRFRGETGELPAQLKNAEPYISPPEYYHVLVTSRQIRVELLSGPKGNKDTRSVSSLCYNGSTWEDYHPNFKSGPRVILEQSVSFPAVLQALGLGSPFCPRQGELFPNPLGRPDSFSDFFSHAAAAGQMENPRKTPSALQLVARRKYETEVRDLGAFIQVSAWLDPARGLAPSKLIATQVVQREGRFQEFKLPSGYEVTWEGYTESVPGLWLPREMKMYVSHSVGLPQGGKDYEPLLKDGRQVFENGIKCSVSPEVAQLLG